MAVKKLLEAIWEPKFPHDMYGFRPNKGCHNALRGLSHDIEDECTSYVLEMDIKGYFDNIEKNLLMKALNKHIGDRNLLNLIRKFLNAGILDKEHFIINENGTPQGSILSPILANIYMYYALIKWFEIKIKPKYNKGFKSLINYADDLIFCFQYKIEAETFYKYLLPNRLKECGLELAEDKTRLIPFGKFQKERYTFDFLGFTHYGGKSKNGRFRVKRKTSRKKFNKSLKDYKLWLKQYRNIKLDIILNKTNLKLRGHYNYYGITDNYKYIRKYYYYITKILFKWLNRRSQRKSFNWEKYNKIIIPKLIKPSINVNIYKLDY